MRELDQCFVRLLMSPNTELATSNWEDEIFSTDHADQIRGLPLKTNKLKELSLQVLCELRLDGLGGGHLLVRRRGGNLRGGSERRRERGGRHERGGNQILLGLVRLQPSLPGQISGSVRGRAGMGRVVRRRGEGGAVNGCNARALGRQEGLHLETHPARCSDRQRRLARIKRRVATGAETRGWIFISGSPFQHGTLCKFDVLEYASTGHRVQRLL